MAGTAVAAPWRPEIHDQAGLQSGTTTLQRFSFAILLAFLFMMFSRVFDIQLTWLHLPGICCRLMGVFLVISGSFLPAFRDRIGKYMLAFTGCMLISIPFSVWRGGSVLTLDQWLFGLVIFTATAALIPDFPQYVRTVRTVALAVLVLTVICATLGDRVHERLFLTSGRFANPNEMAQALLLGLPFWWALFSGAQTLFAKLWRGGALVLILFVISKTGSRGALVSILVIAGIIFLRAPLLGKMKVLVMGGLLVLAAAVTLSQGLKLRYQTFFHADYEQLNALDQKEEIDADIVGSTGSAVDSTATRETMFLRSLLLTAKHPVLGVGPGVFEVAEDQLARSEGKRKGAWLGTHNSFTQVSSECGIPAFFLYCGIAVVSFRKSYAIYRRTKHSPEWKEIGRQALALNYTLIAFVVTGMFIHAAYTALLPVLAGLTVSLVRTTEPLLAEVPAPQPPLYSYYAWPRAYAVSQ